MRIALALAASVVPLTLSLYAQQAPGTPAAAGATMVTIGGCLQPADHSGSLGGTPHGTNASPVNAGDAANNAEPPPLYLLTDARPARAPVGTSGAATTRNADGTVTRDDPRGAPRTYALIAKPDVLARFAGRRVEVDGTLSPPVRVRENQGGTDPQAADVGQRGGADAPRVDNSRGTGLFDSNTERLNVSRIRQTAASCGRQP